MKPPLKVYKTSLSRTGGTFESIFVKFVNVVCAFLLVRVYTVMYSTFTIKLLKAVCTALTDGTVYL